MTGIFSILCSHGKMAMCEELVNQSDFVRAIHSSKYYIVWEIEQFTGGKDWAELQNSNNNGTVNQKGMARSIINSLRCGVANYKDQRLRRKYKEQGIPMQIFSMHQLVTSGCL